MIAVDRFVDADRRVGKTPGFLLVCEQFDILAQRPLVALQRQDVVGLLAVATKTVVLLTPEEIDEARKPLEFSGPGALRL